MRKEQLSTFPAFQDAMTSCSAAQKLALESSFTDMGQVTYQLWLAMFTAGFNAGTAYSQQQNMMVQAQISAHLGGGQAARGLVGAVLACWACRPLTLALRRPCSTNSSSSSSSFSSCSSSRCSSSSNRLLHLL